MLVYLVLALIMAMSIMNIHYEPVYIEILGEVKLAGVTQKWAILGYIMVLMIYTLDRGDRVSLLMGSKYIFRLIRGGCWGSIKEGEGDILIRMVKRDMREGIKERRLYEELIRNTKLLRYKERLWALERMGINYEEEGDIIRLRRLLKIYKRLSGAKKEINRYRWLKGMMKVTMIGIWFKDVFGLVEKDKGVLSRKWINFRKSLVKLRRSTLGAMMMAGVFNYYKLYRYWGLEGETAEVCLKVAGFIMILNLVLNVMELMIGVLYSILKTLEFRKYGKGRRGLKDKEGRRALMGIIIKNISSVTAIVVIKGYIGV